MAFELTKDVRVSVNGTQIQEFKKGKHAKLPTVALAHARSMKVLKDKTQGKEIENSKWLELQAKEAEESASEKKAKE